MKPLIPSSAARKIQMLMTTDTRHYRYLTNEKGKKGDCPADQ